MSRGRSPAVFPAYYLVPAGKGQDTTGCGIKCFLTTRFSGHHKNNLGADERSRLFCSGKLYELLGSP